MAAPIHSGIADASAEPIDLVDSVSFDTPGAAGAPRQRLYLTSSGRFVLENLDAPSADRGILSPTEAHQWMLRSVNGASTDPGRRRELQQACDSVPFWWHSIDLGEGVVTPGHKTPQILTNELERMALPDLNGRSVLDVGAWDGFFSFEAERRGARRVVALDHFCWCLDQGPNRSFVGTLADEAATNFAAGQTPGKNGFDTAHRILGSRVETHLADFMSCDLDEVGCFDVVFFLGVVYHMENPIESLRRLARVTGELAIIESEAIALHGYEDSRLCQFCAGAELNDDPTNWWSPNARALEGLALEAGFSRVECLNPPAPESLCPGATHRYRAVLHAYK